MRPKVKPRSIWSFPLDGCTYTEHYRDMTTNLKLSKIEDHEGYGHCAECKREGLRWIATLSDGTQVGLECAKKVLGFKPAPRTYNWIPEFAPVAEFNDCGNVYVMWQHKEGTATRETLNGNLTLVGGVAVKWQQRGWAA